jgi:chromosome partitioning protein
MKAIAIVSQKGGVGKTTLCANLACAAIAAGAGPVRIMDADPQATLTRRWATPRRLDVPTLVAAPVAELAARLDVIRSEPGVLLIDTPPALSREIALVIAAADFVLVPIQPSPPDLDAVGATVDMLEAADKPYAFIINRNRKRSRWTGPAVAELSHHGAVCPAFVHDWDSLRDGFLSGTSVVETAPASEAASEINAIWSYVAVMISSSHSVKKGRRKR